MDDPKITSRSRLYYSTSRSGSYCQHQTEQFFGEKYKESPFDSTYPVMDMFTAIRQDQME